MPRDADVKATLALQAAERRFFRIAALVADDAVRGRQMAGTELAAEYARLDGEYRAALDVYEQVFGDDA
jgi:hypothetical protein